MTAPRRGSRRSALRAELLVGSSRATPVSGLNPQGCSTYGRREEPGDRLAEREIHRAMTLPAIALRRSASGLEARATRTSVPDAVAHVGNAALPRISVPAVAIAA